MTGPMHSVDVVSAILLGASGPRDAAGKALAYLQEYSRASGVSLWRSSTDGPSLLLGVSVDAESIGAVARLWTAHRPALLRGVPASEDHRVLVPSKADGVFVLLEGVDPRRLDVETIAMFSNVAVRALGRADAGGPVSRDEGQRRTELLAALNLHEWNVARVARAKGVTRKTVYDWMRRLKIPRQRVVKS